MNAHESRLDTDLNTQQLVIEATTAYDLGELQSSGVIELGYEDCNVVIEAGGKKYVAKMFAKSRTKQDIERYTKIMKTALAAGVRHPRLLKAKDGFVHIVGKVHMVVMPYIEGKSFYQLRRIPTDQELDEIAKQAALINSIDLEPEYIFDSWAIPHIRKTFDLVEEYMSEEGRKITKQALERYEALDIDSLPHAFVHGDIHKANLILGDDGLIYLLDFSVSNWYPRVQELAVMAANLMHDNEDGSTLTDRVERVVAAYKKHASLEQAELDVLHDYSLAGVAMEYIGSLKEKHINGIDDDETAYWLESGLDGLRQELS